MKYEILRSFVKRDGKSFTMGQVVDESVIGEVGDLVNAKFIRPTDIRTATIKPESKVEPSNEQVEETAPKSKKKKG